MGGLNVFFLTNNRSASMGRDMDYAMFLKDDDEDDGPGPEGPGSSSLRRLPSFRVEGDKGTIPLQRTKSESDNYTILRAYAKVSSQFPKHPCSTTDISKYRACRPSTLSMVQIAASGRRSTFSCGSIISDVQSVGYVCLSSKDFLAPLSYRHLVPVITCHMRRLNFLT
jgi:hypothetical protein